MCTILAPKGDLGSYFCMNISRYIQVEQFEYIQKCHDCQSKSLESIFELFYLNIPSNIGTENTTQIALRCRSIQRSSKRRGHPQQDYNETPRHSRRFYRYMSGRKLYINTDMWHTFVIWRYTKIVVVFLKINWYRRTKQETVHKKCHIF